MGMGYACYVGACESNPGMLAILIVLILLHYIVMFLSISHSAALDLDRQGALSQLSHSRGHLVLEYLPPQIH